MNTSPSGPAQNSTLAAAPAPSFTIPQGKIANRVVRGASNREIAAAMHLSASAVGSALSAIRTLVNCPPGASRPILALALLRAGQAPPPVTDKADVLLVPPLIGEIVLSSLVPHRGAPIGAVVCLARSRRWCRSTWSPSSATPSARPAPEPVWAGPAGRAVYATCGGRHEHALRQ